ncbi:MAG: hypothetical protein RR939_08960 [Acinetobacter sp.]
MEAASTTSRLEKKIDQMQSDIRMLSDHVTRLTFINEAHQHTSTENRKDLDAIGEKVRHLEHYTSRLDGGMNVMRLLVSIFACVVFALCGWFGSAVIQNTQDISLLKEKVQRTESITEKYWRRNE